MRRLFLIALLAASLSAPASAIARTDLARELRALEQMRLDALVSGESAVLEEQFAAEYTHTNLRGARTTRREELDFYRPGAFSLASGHVEDVRVREYGDIATLTGAVTWIGARYSPNAATTIDLSGRYSVTRVYVWRDERWQLVLSHASRIDP